MPIDSRLVKWDDQPAQPTQPTIDQRMVKWDAEPPQDESWLMRQRNGLASAPINAYLGIKQMFGGLDPVEENILSQNKAAEKAAPVASVLSNVGMAVPSLFVPGAQGIAGAGVVGAIQGLTQPVEGDQTLGNIAKGKLTNTAIGGTLGSAGQWGANKIASAVANKFAGETADAATLQARNALRDSALLEGRAAGYVVPQSHVSPTFLANRLESIGGKAAVGQEATIRNQSTTNALARQALGIPEDAPISAGVIDNLRKTAGQAYQKVAAISPQAADDLEALKIARNEATGWFNAYNRSARPDDLAKAKAARELSDQLETALEAHARTAGMPELIPALVDARKQIAKSYTVERALNKATGDVNAPVLGRLLDKGKPLSDGLDTIAKFNQAFPKVSKPAAGTQSPGVSFFEPALAGMAGATGQLLTGSPVGLLAAGLPLLRGPARSMVLSAPMQSAPSYGAGLLSTGANKLPKEVYDLLMRSGAGYATPAMAGLLSAE